MSKYEIRVTVVHDGKPVGGVAEALRPKAEVPPRWTGDGEPMPDDGK